METIGNLLLKYHIPGVHEAEKRRICAIEINNLLGSTIESKNVKYKDGVLSISVPSVLKSAILLQQPKLTERLSIHNISLTKIQ